MKQLGNILKTNVATCKSVGHPFVSQLGRIYLDVVNVYKVLSENISSAVAQHGKFNCHAFNCVIANSSFCENPSLEYKLLIPYFFDKEYVSSLLRNNEIVSGTPNHCSK